MVCFGGCIKKEYLVVSLNNDEFKILSQPNESRMIMYICKFNFHKYIVKNQRVAALFS